MLDFYSKAFNTPYCLMTMTQGLGIIIPILIIFYGGYFLIIKILETK